MLPKTKYLKMGWYSIVSAFVLTLILYLVVLKDDTDILILDSVAIFIALILLLVVRPWKRKHVYLSTSVSLLIFPIFSLVVTIYFYFYPLFGGPGKMMIYADISRVLIFFIGGTISSVFFKKAQDIKVTEEFTSLTSNGKFIVIITLVLITAGACLFYFQTILPNIRSSQVLLESERNDEFNVLLQH